MELSPLPILDAAEQYRGKFVEWETNRTVSADTLHQGRDQLARQLQGVGLESGQRVVVSVGNGPVFVATLLSVLAVGGSPLLVHAKTPASELKRTALRFGAPQVISDSASPSDFHAEAIGVDSLEIDDWIRLLVGRVDANADGFNTELAALPGVPLHPTSGTTGKLKVAVRPGFVAIEEARHYAETLGITPTDTIMAVAPMCHAYAYGMCVMVPLLSGASVVSMRDFQASRFFEGIAQLRGAILPAVPAMLNVLLFGGGDRLKRALGTVLSAGSPLPEKVARQFRRKTGITVRPLYGTTETGGISVAPAGEGQIAGSCVGPAMRGVEAEVRPHPTHANFQTDVGQLFIRSSSMMSGYLGRNGIDLACLPDGWFNTGDLASIDDSGHIHLKGRDAEVINVEGLKVIPSEVEEVIALIAGVEEVVVYAGHRRSGSQYVKAAVVTDSGVDVQSIRAHCKHHLVYYKRPEQIISVESLPRSPAGKIQRDRLP